MQRPGREGLRNEPLTELVRPVLAVLCVQCLTCLHQLEREVKLCCPSLQGMALSFGATHWTEGLAKLCFTACPRTHTTGPGTNRSRDQGCAALKGAEARPYSLPWVRNCGDWCGMSSDPKLGTVFLVALTIPEEKAIKTPDPPSHISQAAHPYRPHEIHLQVGSDGSGAQLHLGQALCACGSQLCLAQLVQRQMFHLFPRCHSEPAAMTIKHSGALWGAGVTLPLLTQHHCSCWLDWWGVRQFSLAVAHKNLQNKHWGRSCGVGRGCAMQSDKRGSSLWEDTVDDPSGADGASTEPAGEPVGKNIFISLGCSDGHSEVWSQELCKHWLL